MPGLGDRGERLRLVLPAGGRVDVSSRRAGGGEALEQRAEVGLEVRAQRRRTSCEAGAGEAGRVARGRGAPERFG